MSLLREDAELETRGATSATGGARLAFDHVSHRYDRVVALDDVSFTVEPGEIFCLLGHSGCGKTTLLRIGAGVERQVSGTVLVNGRKMSSEDGFVPPETRGIGLMFQDYALFPHLTILKNVMFGLTNLPSGEATRVAMQMLERLGMADFADTYPHALSGGEQQRVALARAIAPKPSVLLMDEPFSGLDQRLRDEVRKETVDVLKDSGATCVMVTHDPQEAMQVADRIGLMRAGKIAQIGSPGELFLRPNSLFAARFFTSVDQLDGMVSGGFVDTPLGRVPANGADEGKRVQIAVRPQAFSIGGDDAELTGTIVGSTFLGDASAVDFTVTGSEQVFHARICGIHELRVGHAVKLNVDHRYVFVFSGDAD